MAVFNDGRLLVASMNAYPFDQSTLDANGGTLFGKIPAYRSRRDLFVPDLLDDFIDEQAERFMTIPTPSVPTPPPAPPPSVEESELVTPTSSCRKRVLRKGDAGEFFGSPTCRQRLTEQQQRDLAVDGPRSDPFFQLPPTSHEIRTSRTLSTVRSARSTPTSLEAKLKKEQENVLIPEQENLFQEWNHYTQMSAIDVHAREISVFSPTQGLRNMDLNRKDSPLFLPDPGNDLFKRRSSPPILPNLPMKPAPSSPISIRPKATSDSSTRYTQHYLIRPPQRRPVVYPGRRQAVVPSKGGSA
jgi:hypothetical protein